MENHHSTSITAGSSTPSCLPKASTLHRSGSSSATSPPPNPEPPPHACPPSDFTASLPPEPPDPPDLSEISRSALIRLSQCICQDPRSFSPVYPAVNPWYNPLNPPPVVSPSTSPRSHTSSTASDLLLAVSLVLTANPPMTNPSRPESSLFPPMCRLSDQPFLSGEPQPSRHLSLPPKPYFPLHFTLWAKPKLFVTFSDQIRKGYSVVGLGIVAHLCGWKSTILLLLFVEREIDRPYVRPPAARYRILFSWYLFIPVDVFLCNVARNIVSEFRMNWTLLNSIMKFALNPRPVGLWWLFQVCKSKINVIMVAKDNEGLTIRATLSHVTDEDIRICSVKSDSLQFIRASSYGSSAFKHCGFSTIFRFLPRTSSLSSLVLSAIVVFDCVANASSMLL